MSRFRFNPVRTSQEAREAYSHYEEMGHWPRRTSTNLPSCRDEPVRSEHGGDWKRHRRTQWKVKSTKVNRDSTAYALSMSRRPHDYQGRSFWQLLREIRFGCVFVRVLFTVPSTP